MAFNVDQFRSAMLYDGARPNLFQITMAFPAIVGSDGRDISFKANSTQLPPSIVGVASEHYFGREVKFPGDRVFPDWSINIINDESFALRDSFEKWLNLLNNHEGNVRDAAAVYSAGYSVRATVTQFGKAGNPIKTYDFAGLFPSQVDPINVAWNNNDTIEEFGVTFQYQYWLSNTTPDSPNAQVAAGF
jgi:hypothetical protein